MIVYGIKSKELAKEVIFEKCPNCGSQSSVELYIFQKYVHLFWIPFCPAGKTAISQCDHCKQILKLKEMPASLKLAYENLKPQTKTPVWTFSGLALVIVLIISGVINDANKDKKNAQLIASPKVGDILEIKVSDKQYTLYKVHNIDSGFVFFNINEYEANLASGLDDIRRKGNSVYSEELIPISKTDLKGMLDKGEILDVIRK